MREFALHRAGKAWGTHADLSADKIFTANVGGGAHPRNLRQKLDKAFEDPAQSTSVSESRFSSTGKPSNPFAGMQFFFINVKKPEEALQLAKEPEIRSHLARYQWRQFEQQGGRLKKELSCVSQRINTGERPDNTDYQGKHPCLASIMRQIGGLRMDPFLSYPLSGRPWIPRIVDHCKSSSFSSSKKISEVSLHT